MKIDIRITKEKVIGFIFLILGIGLILYGLLVWQRKQFVVPLNNLSEDRCVEGNYVSGDITNYVTIQVENQYHGECIGYIVGVKEYSGYIIPVWDNKYILVLIQNKKTKEALKNFEKGIGDGVHLEGKIMRNPLGDYNREWCMKVEEFHGEPEKYIIADYVIQQQSRPKEYQFFIAGAALIILGGVCLKNRKRVV